MPNFDAMKLPVTSYSFPTVIVTSVALVTASAQFAHALSAAQVQQIAQTTTVQIQSPRGVGSGVIIKREGNTYTILTAAHVVDDVRVHAVLPPNGKLVIGNRSDVQLFPGLDIALVQFTSSRPYPVATLGDSTRVKEGQPCYIYGFPERKALFTQGVVTANLHQPINEGRSLACSNRILAGMSGGPMLDNQGHLIGIGGIANVLNKNLKSSDSSTLSVGVPINTFLRVVPQVATQSSFRQATPTSAIPPTTSVGFFLLAMDKREKKDYIDAIADFSKAIALNPSFAIAYGYRGVTYADLKVYPKAIADFNKVITLNPDDPIAYLKRGLAYLSLASNRDAKRDLRTAAQLSQQQNNLEVYNAAVRLLQTLN